MFILRFVSNAEVMRGLK